ncbi:hypothetical protein DM2_2792 [Halorubrum sp. DM2]|nr:hypothetical protein DM2_2792 [Halorubrum sp. DM2]
MREVTTASEASVTRYGAVAVGDTTAEAPAARRAHTRCAPRSFAPLTHCGAYVVCARLPTAPSSPAPRPHSTASRLPSLVSRRRSAPATDSLARAARPQGGLAGTRHRHRGPLRSDFKPPPFLLPRSEREV